VVGRRVPRRAQITCIWMKTGLGDLTFHSPPQGPGNCGIGPIHFMAV